MNGVLENRQAVEAATDLVWLRLAMLGCGSLGHVRPVDRDGRSYLAILPGPEDGERVLRLWERWNGPELAMFHFPDGMPLWKTPQDIRDPVEFAQMMHKVDCLIAVAGLDVPVRMIVRAADALFASGYRGRGDIDLGGWAGTWSPGELGMSLLAASGKAYATAEDALAEAPVEPYPDFIGDSAAYWQETVAGWVLGEPRTSVQGTDTGVRWRSLDTCAKARAACLRMGPEAIQAVPWEPVSSTRQDDTVQWWLLESAVDGMPLLMAIHGGSFYRVVPAQGAPPDILDQAGSDIALLMDSINGRGGFPRNLPR